MDRMLNLNDSFEEFGGDKVDYNPLFATKQRFATRGKAFKWAQNIASENGFALVIANSGHKNRSQPELVASYFRCSRYGSSKINPDTHELTHVFMSHPEALKLFRAYPHVVLIDSIYKTNTYNMALVEVVGVTPTGSSFLIACVLLPFESEEVYTWLLRKLMDILECTGASPSVFVTDRELGLVRALRTLFTETPHLLYRWHAWSVFSQKSKRLASYVSRTWGEHAKKFILCYTNDYFHLGNTATSRVESAHSLLKAWLKSAHLTLDTMWSRIHSMLEGQHSKIRKELEDSMSRPRITHRLFSLLQGNVSTKAIEIMEDGVKRGVALGTGLELGCGYVVRITHGLPCACTLVYLKNNGSREPMPKNDNDMLEELVDKARQSDPVYRKVFLEKLRDILHPENEDILAPAVRENPNGLPRGSTTRNKSGFEHSMRKYGTLSTDASTNIQHMVGDFAAGVAGAPLEKNYTKGLLSTWVKRYGVPKDLWPHFDGWVDVGSDGHCGFRVLSHALWGGEENYIQMRDWCLTEITGSDVYKGLFEAGVITKNGLSKYENTLRRIRFIHQSGCVGDHRMSSDDLFVFSSRFNWTICVIGESRYAKCPKEL
ncbi:hypothetical protein RND81_09G074700 [Saponaria officinalis]|uniref:MULE transposase domain-containing protein n=1 Tax=Saponaria officinalis TaxID=3572 RepID=A0AAW1IHU6_SAPOF